MRELLASGLRDIVHLSKEFGWEGEDGSVNTELGGHGLGLEHDAPVIIPNAAKCLSALYKPQVEDVFLEGRRT